jgi:cob(I)alamin adenosyltransferase
MSESATTPAQDPAEVPVADPRPDKLRVAKSLVLINTGDGKGKTTAALGVVMRARAQGWPVAVIQFLKSGDWKTGEQTLGREIGVDWWSLGEGFTWDSENITKDIATAQAAWQHAAAIIAAGEHRLVMLDEITYILNWGWVDVAEVVEAIRNRPEKVSIVLTGRDAPQELIDVADTVSEVRSIKHAYEQGIAAKKGIDY